MNNLMKVKDLHFYYKERDGNKFWWTWFAGYRITVLDRITGFGNCTRDVETGLKDYRKDADEDFWLASGGFDIRMFPEITIDNAIDKIKQNANTVIPNLEQNND